MHYMLIDVAGLFKSLWGLEQRERKRDGKERACTQEMQKKGALIIVKSEFQTLSSSFSWFCKQYSYICTWFGEWDRTVPSLWPLQGPSLSSNMCPPHPVCTHSHGLWVCIYPFSLSLIDCIISPPHRILFYPFLFLSLALSYHFSSWRPSFYIVFLLINFKHLVSSLLMFCDMAG